jgi:molybdopterin-guanine dinucleotide biosynthesis protein
MNDKALLSPSRLRNAKRAFTTRRVPQKQMQTLLSGDLSPHSGDLVLATVHELGKHQRIEQPNGRRALMLPGDEIIVCYGNRYAPDQFEALLPDDLGLCNLVAGGGLASREVNRNERMTPPTKIQPIGLIGDKYGNPLNIFDYRIQTEEKELPANIVLVVGTSMNAGKTYTAASLVRGLKQSGYRAAGIKATGTGSGGDLWRMKDLGAELVLDFTDAGFSSTYKIPDDQIEQGLLTLLRNAKSRNCDFAVVEIADGLQHKETAILLNSEILRTAASGVVFAAYDSLGAKAGVQWLNELGYRVFAISGKIAQSPLAMREAADAGCPIVTPFALQQGALTRLLTSTNIDTQSGSDGSFTELIQESNGFVIDFESHLEGSLDKRDFLEVALFESDLSEEDDFLTNHYRTNG